MKYITHVIVTDVVPAKESLWGRAKRFLLRRQRAFTMPALQFLRKDGQPSVLINLEEALFGKKVIKLPGKIEAGLWYPMIHNTNDYPVSVNIGFIVEENGKEEILYPFRGFSGDSFIRIPLKGKVEGEKPG